MSWQLIWALWVLALVASFGALEAWAIKSHGTTLSQFVYALSVAWPLLPWVLGALAGGLAVAISGGTGRHSAARRRRRRCPTRRRKQPVAGWTAH